MRKFGYLAISLVAILLLISCASNDQRQNDRAGATLDMTWQDYYDLGVRYLSEGNYEEAIIAFTAAIEIDHNKAAAYVGRGDAYIKLDDTEENQRLALEDYLRAMECDDVGLEVPSKIAEIYVAKGEPERAIEILVNTYDETGDEDLKDRIFDLFDVLSEEQQTMFELGQFLFTDDVVAPSEWTINGRTLWEVGPEDILAVLGEGAVEANRGPYKTPDDMADYGGYSTHEGDCFMVDKESQELVIADYYALSPECRGIEIGMNASDCLPLLGVSELGAEYLIEHVLSAPKDGVSRQYLYSLGNGTWWFHAHQRYGVEGLQWYISYILPNENAEEVNI